jgi:hypothetical protein
MVTNAPLTGQATQISSRPHLLQELEEQVSVCGSAMSPDSQACEAFVNDYVGRRAYYVPAPSG